MWWDWVRWALHVPSRVALLVVIASGVAVSFTIGDTRPGEVGGWRSVVLGVSGAAFLVMLMGWRWFWCGRAVRSVRGRSS